MTRQQPRPPLCEQVMMITGASSAIGLVDATATLDFDRRPREGCHLHGHRPPPRGAPGDPLLPQFGTVSIVGVYGVYGGAVDKIPMGSAINGRLVLKS